MNFKQARAREIASFLVLNFVGSGIFAFGMQYFTVPHHIAPGGVAGLATLINYIWDLPIGVMTMVINIPLLVLSALHISKSFTIRTAVSTLIFSVCADVVGALTEMTSRYQSYSPLAPLLAALYGGVLMGVGNAMVYMAKSTTGGTAIIGVLLQKRFPQFSFGKMLMAANFLVVILSMFTYGNIDSALFATITIFISSIVMDNMVYGLNTNRLMFIISDCSALIEERILTELRRGVTILKGEGGYQHSQKNVIFCVVSKGQFYKVRDIVMNVDEHAFLVGCSAGDVLGKGFKHLD